MAEIVFNSQKQWVKAMKKAASYKTVYINHFPQNCLFKTADIISADCSNFQKCLFCGADVYNLQPGKNTGKLWPKNTGDCTCEQLIAQCTEISSDFKKLLKEKQPALLHMQGHIGAYLGEDVIINRFTYNVIEWTAWNSGDFAAGCIYSYVDSSGRRLNHKGGANQCFTWSSYGKPTKWVKYIKDGKLLENGEWDIDTTKALQKFLKCVCKDGIIRCQLDKYKANVPALTKDTIQFGARTDGASITVIKLQQLCKMPEKKCTGHFTAETCKALNAFLGIKNKNVIDKTTVKALQKYLNNHG